MEILSGSIGNYVLLNDTRYSFFAGNNYPGLVGYPGIRKDAIYAIRKYRVNFSAFRQTAGTSDLHIEPEQLISVFKNEPDSVTFCIGIPREHGSMTFRGLK
jgi:7-keto-8-aminopelargonate synthetase-like enzyme